MTEQVYKYVWGNDKTPEGQHRLKHFKGRKCRALTFGARNSCLVEFLDNGEMLNCSRRALRRVPPPLPNPPPMIEISEGSLKEIEIEDY